MLIKYNFYQFWRNSNLVNFVLISQCSTSLEFWARMSSNLVIRWLLMASREHTSLNFRIKSKAAVEEKRVLKYCSKKLIVSTSRSWKEPGQRWTTQRHSSKWQKSLQFNWLNQSSEMTSTFLNQLLRWSGKIWFSAAFMSYAHLNCIVKVLHDSFPTAHFRDPERVKVDVLNMQRQIVHFAQHFLNSLEVPSGSLQLWTKENMEVL